MAESVPTKRSETGASDATLRRFAGYRLKRAFNVFRSDLATTLEPFGLRMMTYSTLVLIVDNPGLRPSQLAGALDIERPNMVTLLDELEQADLIQRERDPSDRRAHALTATLEGRKLCARAVAENEKREAALLAGLSDAEREIFAGALMRIESASGEAT